MATINKKYGEQYIATASPSTGYRFVKWTGTGVDTTDNPATLTCLGDNTLEAIFERLQYTVSVGAYPANSGSIVFDPVPANTILYTASYDITTVEPSSWITNTVVSSTYDSSTQKGSLTLNNQGYMIGSEAFKDVGFYTMKLPDTTTIIGIRAFRDCDEMTEIKLPNTLTKIEDGAFRGCNKLTSIELPSTVTTIADNAFVQCTSLENVNLEDTAITTVENSSFYGCNKLTSIELPSTVTAIENSAFSGCSALETVVLPASLASVGTSAFLNCSSLNSVTCYATTPPTLAATNVFPDGIQTLYVPAASLNAYRNTNYWSRHFTTITAIQ